MINKQTLEYVRQHADDDVRLLALRGCKDPGVDLTLALQQIQGRQTARHKLPSWAANNSIIYPPHLNMEQCSSEATANYKAALCRQIEFGLDPSLVDLTGGLGVDFASMATMFSTATYVERDPLLFPIAQANLQLLLGKANQTPPSSAPGSPYDEPGTQLSFVNADATDYLQTLKHVSMIFLDPARRDANGARTYGIGDCTPDVLALRQTLLQRADYILVKLSPMLDWRKTVNDLGPDVVRQVHIVAVGGECKELLVLMSARRGRGLTLHCSNDGEAFFCNNPLATSSRANVGETAAMLVAEGEATGRRPYLYEPHAAIMKGGCFDELTRRFDVHAVAANSHLFLSRRLVSPFPGRCFRIKATATLKKDEVRTALRPLGKANITVRNFPLTVAELRKRLRVTDGGDVYIFATTMADGRHMLFVCERFTSS